jgi:DNA helicase-2/ATP-dependent DNA helicase PcrA
MDEFQKEKENLKIIIEKYKEAMQDYELRLKAIPRIYINNPIMMQNFTEIYTEKLKLMEKSINKPFFARIDFARDGEKMVEKFYIGKVGVMDEENNNIVIDWRAPVSSMYYDSNIGRASYIAPEGICTGELLLKRQYNIENSELKSFQDIDTVSNDDLLKPYLGASADSRLKNIVATIQQEQNSIIREPISKNLIIQGVAGSGKTTVALHRIAYLVYNNRDYIKPNQYLVIGPNKFFVSYISGVLPDLDVENVKQLTYEELCAEFLNEDIKLINEDKKLTMSILDENELIYEKIKVSMRFKQALDKFMKEINDNIIPDKDIEIKGYKVIKKDIIKKHYFSIEDSDIYNTLKKKIDRTELILAKYIENENEEILESVRKQYKENTSNLSKENNMNELKELDFVENKIKTGCKTYLKNYFKNIIPNIIEIYIKFLTNIKKYMEIESFYNVEQKIKANIANLKEQKVEFEDLSALIYLKSKICGAGEYEKYKHIAIDEAQDFGEFSFYALKYLLKNSTFSIFGDLAQSIYQYRGIKSWKEVSNNTFESKCETKYLLKSYRTTTEIMNSANEITNYIKLNTAQPVIRHGKQVNFINYNNYIEQIDIIKNILNQYKENEYKTVAIICKDEEDALLIHKELKSENIEINIITNTDRQYDGGVCIITSYLAKGLEFDGVIISNASEGKYDSNKNIDMKLLYVAMTRPLHELNVLYNNNIVKPLKTNVER